MHFLPTALAPAAPGSAPPAASGKPTTAKAGDDNRFARLLTEKHAAAAPKDMPREAPKPASRERAREAQPPADARDKAQATQPAAARSSGKRAEKPRAAEVPAQAASSAQGKPAVARERPARRGDEAAPAEPATHSAGEANAAGREQDETAVDSALPGEMLAALLATSAAPTEPIAASPSAPANPGAATPPAADPAQAGAAIGAAAANRTLPDGAPAVAQAAPERAMPVRPLAYSAPGRPQDMPATSSPGAGSTPGTQQGVAAFTLPPIEMPTGDAHAQPAGATVARQAPPIAAIPPDTPPPAALAPSDPALGVHAPALLAGRGEAGRLEAPPAAAAQETFTVRVDGLGALAMPGAGPLTQQAGGSATVPTFNLPANVRSSDFAPALAATVSLLARDGLHEARLQLHPLEMGPIAVQIAIDGTQARVEFTADVAATRSAIEAGLPELASALREAGLTLSGGGVFQQARERQSGAGQPTGSGTRGGMSADGAEAGEPARPNASTLQRIAAGGVDLYA